MILSYLSWFTWLQPHQNFTYDIGVIRELKIMELYVEGLSEDDFQIYYQYHWCHIYVRNTCRILINLLKMYTEFHYLLLNCMFIFQFTLLLSSVVYPRFLLRLLHYLFLLQFFLCSSLLHKYLHLQDIFKDQVLNALMCCGISRYTWFSLWYMTKIKVDRFSCENKLLRNRKFRKYTDVWH